MASLVVETPAGTIPDLRGMSAREAVRKLLKLGVVARVTGDGAVVSQDPSPGTPIEEGGVCQLLLDRGAPKHLAAAAQP